MASEVKVGGATASMFNASFKSSEIKSDPSDDENNYDNQTSRPTNTPGEIDASTVYKRKLTLQ